LAPASSTAGEKRTHKALPNLGGLMRWSLRIALGAALTASLAWASAIDESQEPTCSSVLDLNCDGEHCSALQMHSSRHQGQKFAAQSLRHDFASAPGEKVLDAFALIDRDAGLAPTKEADEDLPHARALTYGDSGLSPVQEAEEDAFIFQHVGKAGGGSVMAWLQAHHVAYERCHLYSCLHPHMRGQRVLLNVRDPLDRFVSAFDWNRLLTCRPTGHPVPETREQWHTGDSDKTTGGVVRNPWDTPDVVCRVDPQVQRLLFQKYHEDANLLAADLCSKDHGVSSSALRFAHNVLEHGYTLQSRLNADSLSAARKFLKNNLVYVIVLEKGFDFMGQVPKAAFELLRNFSSEEHARELAWTSAKIDDHGADYVHSAKDLVSGPPTNLTDESKRCIVKAFADDYALIDILSSSCRGDAGMRTTCKEALEHILARRRDLLL